MKIEQIKFSFDVPYGTVEASKNPNNNQFSLSIWYKNTPANRGAELELEQLISLHKGIISQLEKIKEMSQTDAKKYFQVYMAGEPLTQKDVEIALDEYLLLNKI